MAYRRNDNVIIEDAEVLFKTNFSGRPTEVNPVGGKRTFCIKLPRDLADQLADEGWTIKESKVKNEDDIPDLYTEVAVNFRSNFPPKVWRITSLSKVELTEETVGILDTDDITTVDVVLNPYHYNVNGKEGIKGYVKSLRVNVVEDPFEQKYADIPERGQQRFFEEDAG